MSNNILDFYTGFEGGDEIQFIRVLPDGSKDIIRMWDGYFDNFMMQIEPDQEGWTSLAYYYHLEEGWYDESPWEIPDIKEAFEQLRRLKDINIKSVKSKEVYDEVCKLLDVAINTNSRVYITLE